MRRFSIFFFLLLLFNSALRADTFSLSFFQAKTDNIFQNIYPESDQVSSIDFYIDKNLSKITLFSEGNYSYLFENSELSYYLHDIGMDYLYPVSTKTAVYFSLIGRGALYRSVYSDFNYFSLYLLAALKSYLSQTSILKSNYSLEYKNYKYSLFDFVSHSLFVSFDRYFQTRTTLKAELNWGYKYFLHPYSLEAATPEDGRGYHGGRGSYLFLPRTQYEGQGIQVFSLMSLLAQGIGDKVGLRISGMKQWTLTGENPFTSVEEFYLVENPSYDDFSWEGYQLGFLLTLEIPWNIELKMGYTMDKKEFPGIESMSLDDEPLGVVREDKRYQFQARVEKDFPRFSLFLSYFYIDNHSNDPFFAWKGHFLSAGIEWSSFFGEKR